MPEFLLKKDEDDKSEPKEEKIERKEEEAVANNGTLASVEAGMPNCPEYSSNADLKQTENVSSYQTAIIENKNNLKDVTV